MINYRKILKSRSIRMVILSALFWVPDKLMLYIQYYLQTGKKLHLKNPKTFNEKLQAYKLYYRNPEMLNCTDKIEVRKYLEKKGFKDILVPVHKIIENLDEFNFDELPDKFVAKTSDGGGGNQILIYRNKKNLNIEEVKKTFRQWSRAPKPVKHVAREWAYDNGFSRKILIEQLLENDNPQNKEIDDYKFFCFDGKFKILWVDKNRYSDHRRGFWNEKLEFLNDVKCLYPTFTQPPVLPNNIQEMIKIAEKLSQGFPFVRIDLYNVNNKIYFSEMTFYPNSGYTPFHPLSFDQQLGSFLDYPKNKK